MSTVLGVGVALRLLAIDQQVVIDDEYHAIGVALGLGYTEIATRLFAADNSIPLTLLYKLVADTVGLSEVTLRSPQLLAGLGALALFPLFARHLLKRSELLLYAALLALSPQMIFYSRYARPYAISTVCCGIAFVAFARFFRSGGTRSALLYGASATTAAYFHPLALPFVLGPPCFAVVTSVLNR